MSVEIIHGDARALPLDDNSVDLIVTSPPYWSLRSYQDGGEHYDGQIGAEATPAEYVAALIECTREWLRVLKHEGSLWINLGDKYGPDKSLLGLPWEYARSCRLDLGLILRAEVIWNKTSGMPESVTDRVRRSHEHWFHMTMQRSYFASVDDIREPHTAKSVYQRDAARRHPGGHMDRRSTAPGQRPQSGMAAGARELHPLGALPGSVWDVAAAPLKVPEHLGTSHFAAFPLEFPRRIIKGWCPPTGRVLDPFGGTGTTALAADVLGRHGISVDASADYCRIAAWRTTDPGERARAMGVEKPKPEMAGQSSLLDALESS